MLKLIHCHSFIIFDASLLQFQVIVDFADVLTILVAWWLLIRPVVKWRGRSKIVSGLLENVGANRNTAVF